MNIFKKIIDETNKKDIWQATGVLLAIVILGFFLFGANLSNKNAASPATSTRKAALSEKQMAQISEAVLPKDGVVLPVVWGDLGAKLIQSGVIDGEKFQKLYDSRGGLSEEEKKLLYALDNGNLKITQENATFLLNLLWALGLGNQNDILDNGPMKDPKYGGADRFASTGGWTLAKGNAMKYYSKYKFITLTSQQQELVERVSKNIYRPCCGNSTYFPDCNHGMAMLGLLELMASQGVSEADMYKAALKVNSFWFSDTYINIAAYLKTQKQNWDQIDSKTILGANFSSASGYRQILSKITPQEKKSGGGCGI